MLLAVVSGFLFALFTAFAGRLIKGSLRLLPGFLPLGLFVYFLSFLPRVAGGESVVKTFEWVPSMGVNLHFVLDGISMIFALMITGIGTLVFFYSANYLKKDPHLDRFFGFLSMFMAAMLGLVLSDNLIALFIFWELTGISSFFLIGYLHRDEGSRKAAVMALAVTGLGGMLLLGAAVLLGYMSGSYSIAEIIASDLSLAEHPLFAGLAFLFLGAAFTKSAQFPFHFWLPGAMKAPTPVSTYLHSATMVKAGLYLVMRLNPIMGGEEVWNTPILIFGAITMVYAAFHTLFRTDLKGILAYSTISALGIIMFLLGLGTREAFTAAIVFMIVHALYKAGLFLVTGAIDKATGTRNITVLGGLAKYMWPLAIASLIAALANGGIPPTLGFVGKDLIYEATLHAGGYSGILTALAVITNILLLYAGFVVGVKPFFGKASANDSDVKKPHPMLWIPPAILGLGSLVFGFFPALLEPLVFQAVEGLGRIAPEAHLKLWHGFNFILLLSGITIGVGTALYFIIKPSTGKETAIARLDFAAPINFAHIFGTGFNRLATYWTRSFQTGFLRYYVLIIMLFIVGLIAYRLFRDTQVYIDAADFGSLTVYEAIVFFMMVGSILVAVFSASRLAAVASIGVLGYAICMVFVFYGAPDVAMTQFAIDTLTVILFVLVLYRLPKYLNLSDIRSRIRDGVLALAFGALMTLLILEVLHEPVNREISTFYAENAYTLAKGKNVVNVILVDFRGMDTLVEITVLCIAAIGVFGLLKLQLRNNEID